MMLGGYLLCSFLGDHPPCTGNPVLNLALVALLGIGGIFLDSMKKFSLVNPPPFEESKIFSWLLKTPWIRNIQNGYPRLVSLAYGWTRLYWIHWFCKWLIINVYKYLKMSQITGSFGFWLVWNCRMGWLSATQQPSYPRFFYTGQSPCSIPVVHGPCRSLEALARSERSERCTRWLMAALRA